MRKLLRKYDGFSIKIKIISVILLTLFLFGCVCLAGLKIVNNSNQELLYNTLATSLSYSAKEISSSLEELESLSFDIIVDSTVQEQLAEVKEQPNDSSTRSTAFRQLNTALQNYKSKNKSISYASLLSDDINIDTNTIWMEKISSGARIKMAETAIAAEGRLKWVYQPEAENPLFIVRCINRVSPQWLDTLGVLFINVDMKKLVESSGDFDGRFGEVYYQITSGESLLYQTLNFPEGIEDQVEGLEQVGYKVVKSDGDRYFAVAGTIPGYEWKYVHLVSYNDMHHAITESIIIYLLVVIIGAALSILICQVLVNRFTIHIFTLSDKMQEFSRNNETVPTTSYDYSNRQDELGLLHRKFDEMAGEIISLIQNDYTNQLLMKDARLKALEAQIDPHFLYNVLQSISWSAKEIGDEQIPKMVDALGKMLRTTLSPEDEKFTVGKEMEFLGYYMTIQQFRFEGQLDFKAEIPAEMLAVKIPKLTIQPLVENAMRYAMEAFEEVCHIEVIGRFSENEILISVSNSGSFFEDDLLYKLEQKQVQPNGFGIGLLNIEKRLHLFCGDEAYLELKNEDDWAVAVIHIPASHYKEMIADVKDDYRR